MVAIRNPTQGYLLRALLASEMLLTANLPKKKLILGSQKGRHSPRHKQASKPRAGLGPPHHCALRSSKRRGYRPSSLHPKHKSQDNASKTDNDDLLPYPAQESWSRRRAWTQRGCLCTNFPQSSCGSCPSRRPEAFLPALWRKRQLEGPS